MEGNKKEIMCWQTKLRDSTGSVQVKVWDKACYQLFAMTASGFRDLWEKGVEATARYMQRLECELHAMFRWRGTCNLWNASYMPRFDGELHAIFGMRVTRHASTVSYMQRLEGELHVTFRRRVTCNFWNASYMPCFDGELHATSGMRVTCHVSMASYMQRLECELHAAFRRRVVCSVWNTSYMPRFDGELHATFGMRVTCHVSTASYMACFDATFRRRVTYMPNLVNRKKDRVRSCFQSRFDKLRSLEGLSMTSCSYLKNMRFCNSVADLIRFCN